MKTIEEYILKHKLSENNGSDIADFIWWQDKSLDVDQKLDLTLQLFDQNPEYGVTLQLSMNFNKMSSYGKGQMWDHYKNHLKGEQTLQREQIEYSLWVDFFEDSETVNEAWGNLIGDYSNENILKRLLTISGPVPFGLKDKLYQKVIINKQWHEYILDSLVGGFFDVYGQIDFQRARIILPILKVDKTSKKYVELNKKLIEFNNKEEYWNSLDKKIGINNV
jgi:hypothetical protein|tara:strand:- start:1497 stop:2159 length:663 start_codon:yes stop_codon:yes gene_type:complete